MEPDPLGLLHRLLYIDLDKKVVPTLPTPDQKLGKNPSFLSNHLSARWFSTRGSFALQGTLGSVGRHFWLSLLGVVVLLMHLVDRDLECC